MTHFSAILWREQVAFDEHVRFVLQVTFFLIVPL
jgi:hypothetical protein